MREDHYNAGSGEAGEGMPEKRVAPGDLQKWAVMAGNLALCGACVWLMTLGLSVATELSWFSAALIVLTVVQVLLCFSLFSVVRRLRQWPDTPRLSFCRFALALGVLPVLISVVILIYSRALPR